MPQRHSLRALIGVSSLALFVALPAAAQTAGNGDTLDLRRVMLSTGGVGYFEYSADVLGDAELSLEVRLDQVDDILKSIVVYDNSGRVGEISLPGREPLGEVFREMPFEPGALGSPANLLNALRGAEIETSGPRGLSGRIVSVNPETVVSEGGTSMTVHRLSVMTSQGLRQLILEETDSIQFTDPNLRDQIDTALEALATNNQQDRRHLSISLPGTGPRTVHVAYVVEVPLWKSAYRLTLGEEGEPAELQGWAVIENLSGEDWVDVDLSVASGNPVTFRQALYDAYFVARPRIPVEVLGRVLPSVDQGGISMQPPSPSPMDFDGSESEDVRSRGILGGAAADMVAAPAMEAFAEAAPRSAELIAAESTQAATQVLFRFPEPVSVESGHSLLLPIISREQPTERPLLYQPQTNPRHPLATVRLENDGDSGLPPGILTLYDRDAANGLVSYLGDARLSTLPQGDSRLVAFALDETVTIDRDVRQSDALVRATIADGALRQTMLQQQMTIYTIEGDANNDRTVILEHPRQGGYELADINPAHVELTPGAYRIAVEVSAGETVVEEIVLEREAFQRVEIATLGADQIRFYSTSSSLSDEVKAVFADLAERVRAVEEQESAARQTSIQIDEIVRDQARLRDNLAVVPTDSDLFQRYMSNLSSQEDLLEGLGEVLAHQRDAAEVARRELADYIANLTI
ncbi:MAG: DUF4139 domain-containing protein [Pseudomonadota bacterium]